MACSPASAVLWGSVGAGIVSGAAFIGLAAGIDEPYGSIGGYLHDAFSTRAIAAVVVQAGIWGAFAMPAAWKYHGESGARSARVRAIVLSPLMVVPLMLTWLPLCLIAKIPEVCVGRAAAGMAWAGSPVIGIPGSFLTPVIVLALYLWLTSRALRRVDASWEDGRCRSCGYDRSGLAPSAQCPECGARQ